MGDSFFKEEDTKAAIEALQQWSNKYPEASKELKELWKANYMKVGHKSMARELIKK